MDEPNDATWRDRIVSNPGIHQGAPIIRGTRVTVSVIVGSLAVSPMEQVVADYPHLTPEDISAALKFAAATARVAKVA